MQQELREKLNTLAADAGEGRAALQAWARAQGAAH
jgi:hypothetical protein